MDTQIDEASCGEGRPSSITDAPSIVSASPSRMMPQKRPAPDVLEPEPKKVARVVGDDDTSRAGTSTDNVEVMDLDEDEDPAFVKLKTKLEKAEAKIDRLKEQNKELKETNDDLEDEEHELRARATHAEKRMANMSTRLAAAEKASEVTSAETSRNLKAEIQAKYEEKLKKSLARSKEQHKKVLSHEKDAQRKKNDDHKEAMARFKREHKEELSEVNRELALLKQKKGQTHESIALRKEVEEFKCRESMLDERMQAIANKTESDRMALEEKDRFLKAMITKNEDNVKIQDEMKQEMKRVKARYEARLRHETERWEIQVRKTSENERLRHETGRTNFAMRQTNERHVEQIAQLERELQVAQKQIKKTKEEVGQPHHVPAYPSPDGIQEDHNSEGDHQFEGQQSTGYHLNHGQRHETERVGSVESYHTVNSHQTVADHDEQANVDKNIEIAELFASITNVSLEGVPDWWKKAREAALPGSDKEPLLGDGHFI